MDEAELDGGLTNHGSVVRDGAHVVRPGGPHSESVHSYLRAVRAAGFDGAPMPVTIEPDGRERLEFIEGDVPDVPYPAWSQTDDALTSIVELLRDMHERSRGFDASVHNWNRTLADPKGGGVMCHNDVELSNVVFRDGVAVALIDFEFAAPGRAVYDLAQLARVCVPVEHDLDQARMGWLPADRAARLRVIADSYGLDARGRTELVDAMDDAIDRIETVARAAHDTGDASVVSAMSRTGGIEKYDRRRQWWARHRPRLAAALD